MDLIPYIYCEKQEPGSMLCAQHALNNLLQSNIWSPENLAEIARKLDLIEFSHLNQNQNNLDQFNSTVENNNDNKSSNYDDSGFFSVQVIDDALHPLGLRIISWKSEEMKLMHDYPENQEAFILNHDLHWFTLRRFGQSVDRWYNLNSMAEDSPTWIGPTFLSMSIAQAEAEGYSIFAVIPLLPSSEPSATQPGRLITCEADEQAMILDQISYTTNSNPSSSHNNHLRRQREEEEEEVKDQSSSSSSSSRTRIKLENDHHHHLNYDDQLQLAIQASLTTQTNEDHLFNSASPNIQSSLNHSKNHHNNNDKNNEKQTTNFDLKNQVADDHPIESNKLSTSLNHSSSLLQKEEDFDGLEEDDEEEDKQLAIAISESLLNHTSLASNSNSNSTPDTTPDPTPTPASDLDLDVDQPTPHQLRLKRLARFS